MGIDIDRTHFAAADYTAFQQRLAENLEALDQLLADPGFGVGPGSMGAELELYVVGEGGSPAYLNQEILKLAGDPQLTDELNRYNLEYNLSPYAISDQAFRRTEREILDKLAHLGAVAAELDARVVPIGILPTLRQSDFGAHCITDRKRYHALVEQLIHRRGSNFRIDINGADPLHLEMADITLEGANTSFQVHYRVDPAHYADTFNALQLVTPLVVALAANSPTLFGHKLWQETRIPLFKQSIDTRIRDRYGWQEPARVNFGHGWVRRGPLELFAETVRLNPPLLPLCAQRSALDELAAGQVPTLAELRLHQGTVWLWNRPIFDNHDGGHLRIELRALPAGPSAVDMVANAAFAIGAAQGLRPSINDLLPALPFATAEYNFYRAAQHGLEASLVWPSPHQNGGIERPVTALLEQMLPVAREGLLAIGVDSSECDYYLGIIERRLAKRRSGAAWQLATLRELESRGNREEALHTMLELFIANSRENMPVADWPL